MALRFGLKDIGQCHSRKRLCYSFGNGIIASYHLMRLLRRFGQPAAFADFHDYFQIFI